MRPDLLACALLQYKYRVDGVWKTSVKEARVSSNEVGLRVFLGNALSSGAHYLPY